MSTQDDKTIAWQGRIQERAAHATKVILDRLATMPKSGLASLSPTERRDIGETIAKSIVDTMASLGTFMTAGAQDFQVCLLEGVNISKGKVALKLIPESVESCGINLNLLAANAGKQVVVAMINGLAYSQAREALSKAITREQTDWVQRSHDSDLGDAEQEQPIGDGSPDNPFQIEPPDTEPQQPGELIAEQPGDGNAEASETGQADPSPSEGGGSDGGGPAARPAEGDGEQPATGASADRDSPLARAGRRVRRPAGDRPATH